MEQFLKDLAEAGGKAFVTLCHGIYDAFRKAFDTPPRTAPASPLTEPRQPRDAGTDANDHGDD